MSGGLQQGEIWTRSEYLISTNIPPEFLIWMLIVAIRIAVVANPLRIS